MSIEENEEMFIEGFNKLGDWMLQFDYLLMMASKMEPLDEFEKTDANRVFGCQSKLWISVSSENDFIYLKGDSQSLLIKGILAILIELLSGRTIYEILAYEIVFLKKTELGNQLSTDRFNGIQSVLEKIKTNLKNGDYKNVC